MRSIVIILAIAIVWLSSTGTSHAFDFKGLKLGETYTELDLRKRFGIRCQVRPGAACMWGTTIAGVVCSARIEFGNRSEVDSISIFFDSNFFSSVRDAALEKFGEPRERTIYGRDKWITWRSDDGDEVTLARFPVGPMKSGMFFSTVERRRADKEKTDAQKRDF